MTSPATAVKRVPWPDMPVEALRTRILQRVATDPGTGCWVWQGYVNTEGYGEHCIGSPPRMLRHRVHRLAYYAWHGEIQASLVIDHICRNRKCCNPAHLRQVTVAQNNVENSGSVGAISRAKTHCVHGHPLSGPNLRMYRGERFCRACQAERNRRYKLSKQGTTP